MKELSVEQKAKAYDKAKARMSRAWNDNRCTIGFMNEIFPELKENDDEKTRKFIIDILFKVRTRTAYGSNLDRELVNAVDWLEKQGDKPQGKTALEAIKEEKVDNANKVELKFHKGDWVVVSTSGGDKVVQIDSVEYFKDGHPSYVTTEGRWFGNGTKAHLWTIQDAKDGDVLQLGRVTAIFQKYIGNGNCRCYCSVYEGEFEIPKQSSSYGCHNAIPATKEQCEQLFKTMREAGYEWDAEKKELKKLVTNSGDVEPTCNEENEKIKKALIAYFKAKELGIHYDFPGYFQVEYKDVLAWLEKQGECLEVPVTTAGSDFDIDKDKDLPLREIFKPFDKVIVSKGEVWHGELVSYADPDDDIIFIVGEDDGYYKGDIMLYNDYTKHLIGKSRDK